MYILFLSLWATAFFVWINRFRTEADLWVAVTLFFYGCGGLSEIIWMQSYDAPLIRMFEALMFSFSILWSAYGLLMYATHYTNSMPSNTRNHHFIEIFGAVPFVATYFIITDYSRFGVIEISGVQIHNLTYMLLIVTPYYMGAVLLLTSDLIHRHTTLWRIEVKNAYLLVVPAVSSFYLMVFILPCIGFVNAWRYSVVILAAESMLILYFVIRENAFGLSFYTTNATRQTAEKLIVEGTGVLQHAMKNNLSIVMFNLQNAKYNYENNANEEKIANNIKQSLEACRHARAILERIQLKTNPIRLKLEHSDIAVITNQVLEQCQTEFACKDVHIEKSIEPVLQFVMDPVHIREVLLNIVSNAMEAVADDGTGALTVHIRAEKKHVIVHVEDNGCGIDPKQIKKIGMPLITSKEDDHHFGLGLYYVKNVVNLHNGRFDLRRTAKGRTVAEVILPL